MNELLLSSQKSDDPKENPKFAHEEQFARIKQICQPFHLTHDQLQNIKESLLGEIQKGLKQDTNSKSSIKCLPTYVQDFPCGCEHGMYLVLEIKENNFHVIFMHLKGMHNYQYEMVIHDIAKELFTGNLNDFFNYIADYLGRFLRQHNLNREELSMVVCSKTTVVQNLAKQLNITNLEENEMVELLQIAINRRKDILVSVENCLCNCTAILLANSWQGDHCKMGINIGNGSNAVYVERVTEIEMCSEPTTAKENMIVNTEWGEFGANGHLNDICTEYDEKVDQLTWNKGRQIFEKLTSGLYLGELARQIFMHCISEAVLFEGYISQSLKDPFSFTSRHVSDMLNEDEGTFDHMRLIFDKLGISQPDENECIKAHYILHTITQRSAHLVAAGIASLMEKTTDNPVAVGLGGSFYFSCRIYHSLLEEKLKECWGKERTFKLKSVENDVAIGSALLAAISKSKEFIYQSEEMTTLLEEVIRAKDDIK